MKKLIEGITFQCIECEHTNIFEGDFSEKVNYALAIKCLQCGVQNNLEEKIIECPKCMKFINNKTSICYCGHDFIEKTLQPTLVEDNNSINEGF